MGLILTIIIGGIAGWVASNLLKGQSLGLVWNIILGVGGAFVGSWIFALMGMYAGGNIIGKLFTAIVGAVIVLLIANKIKKKEAS